MPAPRPTAEQAALAELRSPTCATTTQFFAAHVLEHTDGEPRVHGVVLDGDVHQVHFRPQGEDYFLVVMVRATPDGWDILGARASARARVALSIVSETLLAEDITRATGLDPTDAWSVGDKWTRPGRKPSRRTFTRWTLCPEGDHPGEFEDKLTRLLDLTQEAAPRIRALGATCDVNVTVGYRGYAKQMWGVPIERDDLSRLAALDAGLDIDLYAGGPALAEVP
ncbi:DUF4279 domain-containing protein [Deinococcus soli (ex Cha et al. 2016)]|uniref:DUF4279 domain-containing protein n=1 Tax=Deinococcus soli (ex Cha et al. 2016) TaxID=1309411 RepID=A0A0F7JKI5_9DEIO|nr:DUF4279 domain-containing protein [Deinococcus soli (ex Cha et al. 2016)]AKH16736.1 hypothetical protein SY84_06310 [Deinococcus soli (ex Cha et al. 2016)]